MKPLWEVLFADADDSLLELRENSMIPLRVKTETWLTLRNSKGDIKKIDPLIRDDAMEIFTLGDKIDRCSAKKKQTADELYALPKKLKATADVLMRRRWHKICDAGFVGTPEECPEYQQQCEIYVKWQADKYEVAQKAYLSLLDEFKDLNDECLNLVDTLIRKAHGMYLADLKKQSAHAPKSSLTPPALLDDDVDPELLKELEQLSQVGY